MALHGSRWWHLSERVRSLEKSPLDGPSDGHGQPHRKGGKGLLRPGKAVPLCPWVLVPGELSQ